MTTRLRVMVTAVSIALGACGGPPGPSPLASTRSAADAGGMDALVAAAKAEGKLTVIGLAPDWANDGQMITEFQGKYGIAISSNDPQGSRADAVNAVKALKGTERAPDVLDLSATLATANPGLLAPYRVAAWADIPENLKEATGLWAGGYAGYLSIGCDAGKVPMPATVEDLAKPAYKGSIAINGSPAQTSAGLHAVVLASLAMGGTTSDLSKGVDFFTQLNDAGNLVPIDPNPATIKSGKTPCVIDWLYANLGEADALKGSIDWQVVVPTDAPPVAVFYVQAINEDAPHPAAARLWEEYLFSVAGQNTWLKGYVIPVLFDRMRADGTLDAAALARLPSVTQPAVVLTQDQLAKGQAYLRANWTITIK